MENIFKKKGESSSLSISEIIDSKRGGYLNARSKILGLFVNTIDWRVHVFSSQYADFRATSSDAIIFKTKDFFWIFYCVSEVYMKWRTFSKKGRVF